MAKATYKNPTAGLSLPEVEDLRTEILGRLSHGYRLPFMQWFEDDFRGSEGVEEMAPLERLMYRQLLAKGWASKEAPYLPADDDRLRRLSDCPTEDLWEKHKNSVLSMFVESKHEGKMYHARQLLDYVGQLSKVSANTDNGVKGGRPPKATPKAPPVEKITQTKPNHNPTITQEEPNRNPTETERLFFDNPNETQTKPIKNQNENQELESEPDLEPSTSVETAETDFQNDRQEEDMKAEKQIPISCQIILHQKAETYPDVINQIKALAQQTSNGQVLREFEEWAQENQGDEFRGKPLSAWLRSRESVQAEARTAAADPLVTHLARELAYRSDNLVTFDHRQKLGLRAVLDEGFTMEEIVAVFKVFFQNLDTSRPDEIRFAAKNFVEKAGDLAYVARRKAAEKATEATAVAAAAEKMVCEAQKEREARLEALAREQDAVEDELPD